MTNICSRAFINRHRQRGFALISAMILSVLYFMLMELMLIDSSRALNEAQRFHARVVAGALAESGAELAALQMVTKPGGSVSDSDFQGAISGQVRRTGNNFELDGQGMAIGPWPQTSTVQIQGRIDASGNIMIDYTAHAQ